MVYSLNNKADQRGNNSGEFLAGPENISPITVQTPDGFGQTASAESGIMFNRIVQRNRSVLQRSTVDTVPLMKVARSLNHLNHLPVGIIGH